MIAESLRRDLATARLERDAAQREVAELRESIAAGIDVEADAIWAEIERHTFRYGGATEPGSVDPYLEERHAGMLHAARIARGEL